MFERLADETREAVVAAVTSARRQGRAQIGCGHLLAGLLDPPAGPVTGALAAAGVRAAELRDRLREADPDADPLDASALASLGIDLAAVRRAADTAFGAGALGRAALGRRGHGWRSPGSRCTPAAAQALRGALRVTREQGRRRIGSVQLLAGIVDQADNAAVRELAGLGADLGALRADLTRRTDAAA